MSKPAEWFNYPQRCGQTPAGTFLAVCDLDHGIEVVVESNDHNLAHAKCHETVKLCCAAFNTPEERWN